MSTEGGTLYGQWESEVYYLFNIDYGTDLDNNNIPLNECGNISGGWSLIGVIQKLSDGLYTNGRIGTFSTHAQSLAYTTNAIDTKNFNKLCIKFDSLYLTSGQPSNGNKPLSVFYKIVSTYQPNNNNYSLAYYTSTFDISTPLVINISNINELQLGFGGSFWDSISCYGEYKISKIWLE